jgi:putative ABC transport system permease protein
MPTDPRPLLARLLLRVLLRGKRREFVSGDIEEEYADHILPNLDRTAARRWYWNQVFRSVGSAVPRVLPSRIVHGRKGDGLMSTTLMDMKYALRGLLKTPGFTLVAVLTLALGIGANTAIFSVVYTVLLRPLPFAQPESLVRLWETRVERGWDRASLSRPNFRDYREQNRTFEDLGAFSGMSMNLTGAGLPERVSGARVSAGFFRLLRVEPTLGRTFLRGQDEPGAENRQVLLSNEYWRTRFAADSGIVGQSLTLDGNGYTVVGVLPPGSPWLDYAQVFTPLVRNPEADRENFILAVIGRLAPGASIETARADLESVAQGLQEVYPALAEHGRIGFEMQPANEWIAGDRLRRALWVLLGAVGFLLLIASVNLANLLLARATARQRETAVRAALGAGRGRIVRQLLAESLVLGLIGAGVGLLLAVGAIRLVRVFDPGDIPRLAEISVNVWVLGFTVVVGVLSGVLAGLAPAFQVSYSGLVLALREGDRSVAGGRAQRRLRSVLVGAEVALSLMLLVGSGLLIRSFNEVLRVDRGFQSENRLFFTVTLSPSYADGTRTSDFINQLLVRINSMPQVRTSAAVNMRPIVGGSVGMGILAGGQEATSAESVPWASWRLITGDYFQALGLPLLRGRTFTELDEIGSPWRAIISERLAEMLWPGEEAVGQQAILWAGQNDFPAEVVGVVGNMRERGLDADPTLAVYLPYYGAGWSSVQFLVHTSGDPLPLVRTARSMLAELDPNVPLSNVDSFEAMVSDSVATRRFNMVLLLVFAGLALVLALAGIYGVQSYSVARRTSEIGIRVALGATGGNVIKQIAGQGMVPTLVGIVVGSIGALALSRFLSSLLFGIAATDVTTYVAVGLLVAATGLVSCYVPARRAMRVDPAVALREE